MLEIQKLTEGIETNFRKYVIEESIERIYACLDLLEEDEIWRSPNVQSNSVGHLILHLCGNARQYIHSTLGGMKDNRIRHKEFTTTRYISRLDLKDLLYTLSTEMWLLVRTIPSDQYMKRHRVQCFDMTTLDILIHVIEHFTYHTGQIVYMTKALKNIDTGFYKDIPLD